MSDETSSLFRLKFTDALADSVPRTKPAGTREFCTPKKRKKIQLKGKEKNAKLLCEIFELFPAFSLRSATISGPQHSFRLRAPSSKIRFFHKTVKHRKKKLKYGFSSENDEEEAEGGKHEQSFLMVTWEMVEVIYR